MSSSPTIAIVSTSPSSFGTMPNGYEESATSAEEEVCSDISGPSTWWIGRRGLGQHCASAAPRRVVGRAASANCRGRSRSFRRPRVHLAYPGATGRMLDQHSAVDDPALDGCSGAIARLSSPTCAAASTVARTIAFPTSLPARGACHSAATPSSPLEATIPGSGATKFPGHSRDEDVARHGAEDGRRDGSEEDDSSRACPATPDDDEIGITPARHVFEH